MIDIYGGGGVYRVNEMHIETHAFLPLGRDQSYKSYIYSFEATQTHSGRLSLQVCVVAKTSFGCEVGYQNIKMHLNIIDSVALDRRSCCTGPVCT
jgi:hypothetical protein